MTESLSEEEYLKKIGKQLEAMEKKQVLLEEEP